MASSTRLTNASLTLAPAAFPAFRRVANGNVVVSRHRSAQRRLITGLSGLRVGITSRAIDAMLRTAERIVVSGWRAAAANERSRLVRGGVGGTTSANAGR